MMNTFISGERQYDFVSKFNYVREAGTCGEQRAAETILQELKKENSDAQIRTEEFSFFAPQIKRSFFEVTAPYHKVYEACTFGFCANTDENGLEADFVYLENADDINMKQANGKIVMLNNYMSRTMLEKLVKAGALGFVSFSGTPIDTEDCLHPKILVNLKRLLKFLALAFILWMQQRLLKKVLYACA